MNFFVKLKEGTAYRTEICEDIEKCDIVRIDRDYLYFGHQAYDRSKTMLRMIQVVRVIPKYNVLDLVMNPEVKFSTNINNVTDGDPVLIGKRYTDDYEQFGDDKPVHIKCPKCGVVIGIDDHDVYDISIDPAFVKHGIYCPGCGESLYACQFDNMKA